MGRRRTRPARTRGQDDRAVDRPAGPRPRSGPADPPGRHVVHHPPGAAVVPAPAVRAGTTTARPAARPPKPRCAPGSRPSARWATTTTTNSTTATGTSSGPSRLEEANLLHARRAARRGGWWGLPVISAMQGLRILYNTRAAPPNGHGWWRRSRPTTAPGRRAHPRPGRRLQPGHGATASDLAQDHDRDLPAAAALQEKLVAWNRQQAAPALALPAAAPLDDDQRNRIRTLGVSCAPWAKS